MNSPIQQKSRDFAIRIIRCYSYLFNEKHEQVISKQLLRCGTSIGANTRESKNAQSRMDFLNKLNIALKEADETEYWLDLLHETKYLDDKMYNSINKDCVELTPMTRTCPLSYSCHTFKLDGKPILILSVIGGVIGFLGNMASILSFFGVGFGNSGQ